MADLSSVLSQYSSRLEEITVKYDSKISDINAIQEEMNNLPNFVETKGPDWVNSQQALLEKKITDKTVLVDKWLSEQKQKLADWLKKRKDAIENEIKETAKQKELAEAEEKSRIASSMK